MTPKLYATEASPVVRGVLMLLKAIELDVEFVHINLLAGENLTPDFLKLNPQHTVPTLEDDGFVIWDSHAINIYLVEKYAKDDSLYPKDIQKRAVIHQRLHFDSGILFPRGAAIIAPILRKCAKSVPKEKADSLLEGYGFLEKFLEGIDYVAGDYLSIADFSIAASISSGNILVPIPEDEFPNIWKWFNRMKSLPCYQEGNEPGLKIISQLVKSRLAE